VKREKGKWKRQGGGTGEKNGGVRGGVVEQGEKEGGKEKVLVNREKK